MRTREQFVYGYTIATVRYEFLYLSEPNSVLNIVYVRKIGILLLLVTSNNQYVIEPRVSQLDFVYM